MGAEGYGEVGTSRGEAVMGKDCEAGGSTEGQPLDPFRARMTGWAARRPALGDFAGKRQAVADGQQHHLDTLILVNEDVESSDRIG
jgi:hypothetical protein